MARRRTRPLTDWLLSDEEVLERVDRALAELEAEEYRRRMPEVYAYGGGVPSIPLERVAARAGIAPERILEALDRSRGGRGYARIRCGRRSRLGWCLRHRDLEEAVARVDPRMVEAARELRVIRASILPCTRGLLFDCRATRSDLEAMLARAAVIADELGIPEERVARWLGLRPGANRLYLADGEYTVVIE